MSKAVENLGAGKGMNGAIVKVGSGWGPEDNGVCGMTSKDTLLNPSENMLRNSIVDSLEGLEPVLR